MRTALILIAVASLSSFSPSLAQDMDDRVRAAIGASDTGGEIFSDGSVANTLKPFDGTRADEQDLLPEELETEGLVRTLGDSNEAGVYNLNASRVPRTIDPEDEILDRAIWASVTGVGTLGDIADGTARSCTYGDFGSVPPFERACERISDFTEESCTVLLEPGPDGDVQNTELCAAYLDNPTCASHATTCVETAQTRLIDGVEEARLCWAWRVDYICDAPGMIGSCTPYEDNPFCEEIETTCLGTEADGSCAHEDVTFLCGNPDAVLDGACSSIQVCQGSVCEGVPVEEDENFAQAAAYLSMADDMATGGFSFGDSDCVDAEDGATDCTSLTLRIFDGQRMTCEDTGIIVGDCCTNNGLLIDLFGGCSANEIRIANAAEAGLLHSLGDYCDVWFLACLRRERSYCVYNTMLARIFNQQVRDITGAGWGSAKTENCAGLTPEELGDIDLAAIDLSEAFADMIPSEDALAAGEIELRLKDRIAEIAAAAGDG